MIGFATVLCAASFGVISVTNHVGGVLTGELTSVTNGQFTLAGRTLPLAVLTPSERLRVQRLAGCDLRSARERREARLDETELKRIAAREAEGQITPEQAAVLRRHVEAAAAFRREQRKGK